MNRSKIPWTDFTWSPVTGCTKQSPGCANCYAEAYHRRFRRGDFTVKLHPGKLGEPTHGLRGFLAKHGRRPRVFVCPMADLFHDEVPDSFVRRVWESMWYADHIDFLVLTKRSKRMHSWVDRDPEFLVRNVWLGVTAENQEQADKRIPLLLDTPAVVRFASIEPMLGEINLTHMDAELSGHDGIYQINALTGRHTDMGRPCSDVNSLDWVICGGESGPQARPTETDWVRSLRDQCALSRVPFYFKQWGPAGGPTENGLPLLNGRVFDQFPQSVLPRTRAVV